jgi:hypothetical protein
MLRAPRKIGWAAAAVASGLGAGVPWSGASAGMVDRPSKRQRTRDKPPDWVGGGNGCSLGTRPRPGARVRRSRASETPRGMVERPIQAPGGRRRRPGRASFAPHALRSEANGREPGRPAPPSSPRAARRRGAGRVRQPGVGSRASCVVLRASEVVACRRLDRRRPTPDCRRGHRRDGRAAQDAVNCAPSHPKRSTPPWPTRPSSPRRRAASA